MSPDLVSYMHFTDNPHISCITELINNVSLLHLFPVIDGVLALP